MSEVDRSAPYAPANSVLAVVRRYRERGLPVPLTAPELVRVGISEGNAGRTLAALRFLGLVDEDGGLTTTFERLRRANSSEYPDLFADILRHAYAEVFQIIDPATAGDIAINDAFRNYNPQAQRARMVVLFTGLCREAGIMPGEAPETRTRVRKADSNGRDSSRPVRNKSNPQPLRRGASENILEQPALFDVTARASSGSYGAAAGRYALLEGLLRQLPADARWSQKLRGRWLQAFTASLDLLVEVTEEAIYLPSGQNRREEEGDIGEFTEA